MGNFFGAATILWAVLQEAPIMVEKLSIDCIQAKDLNGDGKFDDRHDSLYYVGGRPITDPEEIRRALAGMGITFAARRMPAVSLWQLNELLSETWKTWRQGVEIEPERVRDRVPTLLQKLKGIGGSTTPNPYEDLVNVAAWKQMILFQDAMLGWALSDPAETEASWNIIKYNHSRFLHLSQRYPAADVDRSLFDRNFQKVCQKRYAHLLQVMRQLADANIRHSDALNEFDRRADEARDIAVVMQVPFDAEAAEAQRMQVADHLCDYILEILAKLVAAGLAGATRYAVNIYNQADGVLQFSRPRLNAESFIDMAQAVARRDYERYVSLATEAAYQGKDMLCDLYCDQAWRTLKYSDLQTEERRHELLEIKALAARNAAD